MRAEGATSLAEHDIPPLSNNSWAAGHQKLSSFTYEKILCLFKPFPIQVAHLNIFLTKKILLYLISLSPHINFFITKKKTKIIS